MDVITNTITNTVPEALRNVAAMLLELCENWRKGGDAAASENAEQTSDDAKKRKVSNLVSCALLALQRELSNRAELYKEREMQHSLLGQLFPVS